MRVFMRDTVSVFLPLAVCYLDFPCSVIYYFPVHITDIYSYLLKKARL